MKGVRHHIERVRAQPHHIRKRVVFGIAGGVAGLIGFIWLGSSLAAGAFFLHPTSFAQALAPQQPVYASTTATPDGSNLAGAAAAFNAQQQSEPAHIVIVNAPSSASKAATATTTQTTIPF